jgi:acyl-CoA thioesterase I
MNMPVAKSFFKSVVFLVVLSSAGCTSNTVSSRQDRSPSASQSPSPSPSSTVPVNDRPVIMAFGDSLIAGFGLRSEADSFPAKLQARLDAKGYNYRVVNAGVSGDTSAGGARRIDWAMQQNPQIVIVELGGNDALRGQPPAALKQNLAAILERAIAGKAKVVLAGMEAPPNLGAEYTREFRQVYRDLAREFNVVLIPFFLEGVGGIADLNQPDGIHPTARGVDIILDNVWRSLEPMLVK